MTAEVNAGLKDFFHRPFDIVIDEAARALGIKLACIKLNELRLVAELWTYSALAKYTKEHA